MLESTEARWFFEKRESIVEIEKWFGGSQLTLDAVNFERSDYYLKLPGISNLGIKIREPKKDINGKWQGKLEAKILRKELSTIQLEGGNAGYVNQWIKFSFNLPAGESTLVEILDSFSVDSSIAYRKMDNIHHWVRLDKNRLLVKFDVEKKELITGEQPIQEGCGIELTALQMNDATYYSFGLESFSDSGKQEQNLSEGIEYVFGELKVTGLSPENSLSYPQFLSGKL